MKKILLILGLSQPLMFITCSSSDEKNSLKTEKHIRQDVNLSGKQLSLKYCQSCHLYPEPSELDKHTWERSVLPLMGRLFGFYEDHANRETIIKGAINPELVNQLNIFPHKQRISDEAWKKIEDYYISTAPDSLPSIEYNNTSFAPIDGFEIIVPSFKTESHMTTLVKIDQQKSNIYFGESKKNISSLTILDENFNSIDTIPLPTSPVDVHIDDNGLKVTLIGSLNLSASNNAFGELLQITRAPNDEKYAFFSRFLEVLNRPLQTVVDDINGNGAEDFLVAEFGYYTGSLTLFENIKGQVGSYKKRVLKHQPGALRSYVRDMNEDGYKDIITLFGQGDEGISIFYSDREGEFNERRVLRFGPSSGSVYFELVDFNNDGFPDILYCNGDNGDYPPILKDYHGIRIFENDGTNNFELVYFYPMHGTYKCSAADFKGDGTLDIVAIAYFPDSDSEAEQRQDFVYLKKRGHYSFHSYILPDEVSFTRWVTFDIGDVDGDGFKDILLGGSGTDQFSSGNREQTLQTGNLLLLKNTGS